MKKVILITTAVLMLSASVKAQGTEPKAPNVSHQAVVVLSGNTIFSAVEQEPTPVGGMSVFYDYITHNIVYPKSAKDQDIHGKVFLTFIVEKDGSLMNIKVLRGLSPDIDAEAVRVLQNAPKWNPGMQNGRAVRVQYNVPISFPPPKIN